MSEWKEFRIDEIGEVITGSTPSTKNSDYWNGTAPFYSPADFHEQVYCNKTEKNVSEQAVLISRPIPENAIMFTCIASIGKMAISNNQGITNQQINTLIPKADNFDYRFLYYILFFNRNRVVQLAPQTTIPIINKTDFSSFSFNIPISLSEQRKIARILSTVDAVIEKTEAAIAKYKAIKSGMMRDLFTRGIDLKTGKIRPSYEDAPELYKQSELGWVPKEWEVVRIDELASMKSGEGITSKSIFDFAQYPVYGGNGLRGFTTMYTHDGNYILIGRQGALCGNVNRVRCKFYASEHAVVVSVFNQISLGWLSQLLDEMNLNQYSEASAQPGLAVSKILSLMVKKPQFDEQNEISKHLLSA